MEQTARSDAPIYMNIRRHHKVSSTQKATNEEESTESPVYDHIDINPMQESSKKSDLDSYIAMILHAGKESHAGAAYQTRDFSAVCIGDEGGVVSLDYYGVTLLLPPLSLQESCVTILLYMERTLTMRVHGNPTYASPVIRVGCISNNMSTLHFKEPAILSLPLFDWKDSKHILPFYQQGEKFTGVWTELSTDENTSINDGVRCTISIDKTGLYTCLNYTPNDIKACDTGRRVLPVQCSAFVGRLSTEDVRIEVAFWLSSETQLAKVIQKQNAVHMNLCDGSRELLLDISHMALNKSLVVDVTGICDGWIVYGGKQKHIPLTAIHEELKGPDSLYTVDFKFNRNKGCEANLSCKLRTYIKDHAGEKQKLSLFRYNCMRKSSSLDLTVEKVENNRCIVQQPGSRDILDILERCLEHVTKIISSNFNGVWEKRFAESLNIPASLVKSAKEICLIEKALNVFIGSRIATMTDNEIVFDFISASNNIYKELENEATERRKNRAAKSLSLPQGAKLTKPRYRTTSYSVDTNSTHLSRNPVTPTPRCQSLSYHWCPEEAEVVCCDKDVTASSTKGMLTVHEDVFGASSSNHHYEESHSENRLQHSEDVLDASSTSNKYSPIVPIDDEY